MKEIINKTTTILTCIIIIIANILVGTPYKENTKIITNIAVILFIFYIIVYKICLKKQYIDIIKSFNKLDICVIILCISPVVPILFKTAIKMQDSINILTRYVTILIIYFMCKILFNQDKKFVNYIINTTIILGVLSSFLGFENLLHERISKILYEFGVPLMFNDGKRMFGNIGYANTFALSVFIPLIFNTEKLINNKKSFIRIAINFLFISCIILTYTKAMYILVVIWMIVYSILLKNEKDMIFFLTHIGVTGILAIIYSKIFLFYFRREMALQAWCFVIIFMILSVCINKLINRFIEKREINLVKFIVCYILGWILIIGIGLKLSIPFMVFETATQKESDEYIISEIAPNMNYKIEFDIQSEALNDEKIYTIQLQEEGYLLDVIKQHKIEIGTYSGTKYIEIETDSNTYQIRLNFYSNMQNSQKGLKINKFKINGQEYILNYLYLPNSIVNLLRNFNSKSLSVTDRLTYYKDALKLIQRNPWTGIGGNGWRYSYKEVRSFDYITLELHSFPLQIYLEYGIGAIITYVILLGIICEQMLKASKNMQTVYMSLGVLILHSVIDFDLSYMNMLIYTFVFISIVSADYKKINN